MSLVRQNAVLCGNGLRSLWENEKNVGLQHFIFFPTLLKKYYFQNIELCEKTLTLFQTSPGFYVSAV